MTREERDKKVAERKARMEGSPDIGGVTLPFSRATLLQIFWVFALTFPAWTMWNARGDLTFETIFAGSVLYVACLLPSWFWTTGRIQGLPIFPIFGLTFLPTYVTPLWQGHSALAQYTSNEINTAAWTVTGFLVICQLFWQQMAVRAVGVPQAVRMIDLKKAGKVLMVCLFAQVMFSLLSLIFWQLGGGAFAALRGFATAAGTMGIFVFSYQLGLGDLKPGMRSLFLIMLSLLVIQQAASLVLATALPTLGIAFAGYILGAGKIPWKALVCAVAAVTVLHAGKYDMREIYLEKREKSTGLMDYPRYFAEWVGYGLTNLGMGKEGGEKREDVSSTKERSSLIQLMIRIQTSTPSQVPYLQGASYRFIPELLIPRIFKKEKVIAHMGNWILSYQYGILQAEEMGKTSVGFDPIMEAYANFGFIAVFCLAVMMGFFLGWVTRLTIHVPMLSFGFLFGVQVIAAVAASFNTAGVFVSTVWQSLLALCGLSLVLMHKQNNPVWKYYAMKIAEKLKFKPNAKLEKTFQELKEVLRAEDSGSPQPQHAGGWAPASPADIGREEGGPTSLQTSPTREELRRVEEETSPVRHERPTRFVYGNKKT